MDINLAVLIDFENIAAGTEKEGLGRFDVEALMHRVKDKGRVLVARSYADWGRFSRFKQSLLSANVTMMELTSHGMQDKNRADIAMVVDGMELAFTKDYIDTFVIVSGDSDFTPMVLKMRELNKRVIGCGTRSSTSRLLIQACDEFVFYDSIAKAKQQRVEEERESRSPGRTLTLREAFDLVEETVEGLQRENPEPRLAGTVKSAMLRKSPDFNETDYGFHTFARFLEAAQQAGRVKVVQDNRSGGYRVDTADAPENEGSEPIHMSRGPRDGGGHEPRTAAWIDPYLPEGGAKWVEILDKEGLNPLSASTRKAILDLIEVIIEERISRKRRCTVQFVQEDVRRRIRRTHPDLPSRAIRCVFNALLRAGVLLHPDGSPVRTGSAPFTLTKSGEKLNHAVVDVYLDTLNQAGVAMDDLGLAAEVFLGDKERKREIEEQIAWLKVPADEAGSDEIPDSPNLDHLLTFDEDAAMDDAAGESSMDQAVVHDPDGERVTTQVPVERARRTRISGDEQPEAAAEAAPFDDEPSEPVEDDGAKRRRPRRRKVGAKKGSEELDAFLTFEGDKE